jgi:peptidyl-prolyl cis-trans isomerase B (cyclophilin B)
MAKVPREVGMTRDPADNGSQFFICVEDAASLDRTYSAFGKVVKGMDAVDKIVSVPCDEQDNPHDPIEMTVRISEE